SIKTMKEAGVNFGITTLPTINGKPMKAFGGIQNAHVSAYSKYPKAAQLLAKFLASKEGAEILYSKASKVTSRADISDIKGLSEDKDLSVFFEQFKNAVPMQNSKRISYYWTISDGLLGAVFDGT
ncbi:extracellular solute-binding protein, partial [Clostridium perfringens]|nr:extracellular solute-binding protein [Clostridium perfringens]